MSNWYRPGKRHYGRKPHTRRARGLKRTDFGKKKPRKVDVIMPNRTSESTLAEYFEIYSRYCKYYERNMNPDVAMYFTLKYSKFANGSEIRVRNAIRKVEEFKKLNGL